MYGQIYILAVISALCISQLSAAPASEPKVILIVKQTQDNNFDGTFNSNFESEDGISVSSKGYLKDAGTKEEAQVIEGSYSYTAPDGTPIVVNYIADDKGFRAEGAHLPTPPPIPEGIARALEFLRSLPPSKDDE